MCKTYQFTLGAVCMLMGLASVSAWGQREFSEGYVCWRDGFLDVEDLENWGEMERRFYNRITPPGTELTQVTEGFPLVFSAGSFQNRFLEGLRGEDQFSVPVYRLWLSGNSNGGDTVLRNVEGDVLSMGRSLFEDRVWPEGMNPSRVTVGVDLVEAKDLPFYEYARARVEDAEGSFHGMETFSASLGLQGSFAPRSSEMFANGEIRSQNAHSQVGKLGGMATTSMGADFGFCKVELTNGNVGLTWTNASTGVDVFGYTMWHESNAVVSTWTNDLDVAVTETSTVWTAISPNFHGLESVWNGLATNVSGGSWTDGDVPVGARVRFYALTEHVDSDKDGLFDGAEIFVYHTRPDMADTDGDGMNDADEVGLGFDPTVSDGFVSIWISTAAGMEVCP